MNGWQRVGVVLGAILAVPAVFIAMDINQWGYVVHDPSPSIAALRGQEWANAVYDEAKLDNRQLRGCIQRTILISREAALGGRARITCERNMSNAVIDSLPWALLPFLIVFGCGYVVAWVYRGFRPRQT